MLADFLDAGAKTLIFELEFLAAWLAIERWQDHLRERPVVFFVDNNGVRDSLLSARARVIRVRLSLKLSRKPGGCAIPRRSGSFISMEISGCPTPPYVIAQVA